MQMDERTSTSPSILQSPHRCARPPAGPKVAYLGQPEHMRAWTLTSPLRRHPAHRVGCRPGGAKLALISSQVVHNLCIRSTSPSTLQPEQWTLFPPRGPNDGTLPHPHVLLFTSTSPATRHPPHRSGFSAPARAKEAYFSRHTEHLRTPFFFIFIFVCLDSDCPLPPLITVHVRPHPPSPARP
jgi:hypothetical protein